MMEVALKELKLAGFSLKETALTDNKELPKTLDHSTLFRWLLGQDIRRFSALLHPFFPPDLHNITNSLLSTSLPVALQIVTISNIGQPGKRRDEDVSPRLMAITLSDGHSKAVGIEYEHLLDISIASCPPGSKVLYRGGTIRNGKLLLTPTNISYLGGEVAHLLEAWKADKNAKRMRSLGLRGGSSDGKKSEDYPPQFDVKLGNSRSTGSSSSHRPQLVIGHATSSSHPTNLAGSSSSNVVGSGGAVSVSSTVSSLPAPISSQHHQPQSKRPPQTSSSSSSSSTSKNKNMRMHPNASVTTNANTNMKAIDANEGRNQQYQQSIHTENQPTDGGARPPFVPHESKVVSEYPMRDRDRDRDNYGSSSSSSSSSSLHGAINCLSLSSTTPNIPYYNPPAASLPRATTSIPIPPSHHSQTSLHASDEFPSLPTPPPRPRPQPVIPATSKDSSKYPPSTHPINSHSTIGTTDTYGPGTGIGPASTGPGSGLVGLGDFQFKRAKPSNKKPMVTCLIS